jgi:CRP-like cAMP-binding protein
MEQYLFILRNSPFFQGMSDEEILSVLQCVNATVLNKKKGEYILRVGDSTETMGLVLRGAALVLQEDLWGHRNIIYRIEAGDFFAESFAATPGSVLDVNIVSDEETQIMLLHMGRLLQTCPHACAHHNRLVRNMVSVMARRVMNLNEKITHMAKRSTREKLLSYLSAESIRQGKRAFAIPYDRQQLADYLCVERAAMSVELSKLQKEGFLKTNRNWFELFSK